MHLPGGVGFLRTDRSDQLGHRIAVDPLLAFHDDADAAKQEFGCRGFEQDADGAEAQRFEDLLAADAGGEHDRLDGPSRGAQLPQDIQGGALRHVRRAAADRVDARR
jgi:hypothetical protein